MIRNFNNDYRRSVRQWAGPLAKGDEDARLSDGSPGTSLHRSTPAYVPNAYVPNAPHRQARMLGVETWFSPIHRRPNARARRKKMKNS